jgi:GNAT superfamily N-acetyltransferase
MYEFRRVGTDNLSNTNHARLLADVFEKSSLFTPQFIQWQYADNPAGSIVGYNAMAGDVIAAHYVAQPFDAKLNGETCRGLLSLNTATHKDHRGKGLFTKLADLTYTAAANEGYAFVIGVANQNSVRGFTKHLGFQLVGKLQAKVGVGALPALTPSRIVQYERIWNADMLNWRMQNPSGKYFSLGGKSLSIFSKTHLPFVKAHMISVDESLVHHKLEKAAYHPLTLYIGANAGMDFQRTLFFEIPNRFRTSPLHLIFKELHANNLRLDFDNIRFRLIDFDAY